MREGSLIKERKACVFLCFKTYTCIQSYKMFYFKQRHFHKNSKYSWIHGIQQSVQQRRPWGVREGQEVRKLVCTDTSKNWISEFFQQTFVDKWTFIFKITASFSGNNFNCSILRIIKWKICAMCNLITYLTLELRRSPWFTVVWFAAFTIMPENRLCHL